MHIPHYEHTIYVYLEKTVEQIAYGKYASYFHLISILITWNFQCCSTFPLVANSFSHAMHLFLRCFHVLGHFIPFCCNIPVWFVSIDTIPLALVLGNI